MNSSTQGSSLPSPLAALASRIARQGLRLSKDTPRWVQRAASRLNMPPAFIGQSIGQSIDSFAGGVMQRFPDLSVRFLPAQEDSDGYAAMEMPFFGAGELAQERAEETEATFETATEFLTRVRSAPAGQVAPQQALPQSAPAGENRIAALRRRTQAESVTTAAQASPPAQVQRAAQPQSSPLPSIAPLSALTYSPDSLNAVPSTGSVPALPIRAKSARVISAVEEVTRKPLPAVMTARASTPAQTEALADLPIAESAHVVPSAAPIADAPTVESSQTQASDAAPVDAPAIEATDPSTSSPARMNPMMTASLPTVPRQTDPLADPPVMSAKQNAVLPQADTTSTQAPALRELPVQRATLGAPANIPPIMPEALEEAHRIPNKLPASQVPAQRQAAPDLSLAAPADVGESKKAGIGQAAQEDAAPVHVQRATEHAVRVTEAQPPALPLVRKAVVSQLGRAGQAAHQASGRIMRLALPSLPEMSAMPESEAWSSTMQAAEAGANDAGAAGMNRAGQAADQAGGWMPQMSAGMDLPALANVLPGLPDAPPLRASLPGLPAMPQPAMPQMDMPLAQARNVLQSVTHSPQAQAMQMMGSLPAGPAMPSLQGAASQMQQSVSQAASGGARTVANAMQGGSDSAGEMAASALSGMQGALNSLTAQTPKTDLDKLARQLLPHLKRMLSLERERMRPF